MPGAAAVGTEVLTRVEKGDLPPPGGPAVIARFRRFDIPARLPAKAPQHE